MEKTHTDILKGLIGAGIRWRYGEKPDKWVKLRVMWELKHIMESEYVDYYLMAFWILRHSAGDINYWARGTVSSSIICYCLGLTEIDPMKYGLHAERFVNDELPKFQFDIESSRLEEFKKKAEEVLVANEKDFDIASVRGCLFQDVNPSSYLNIKNEREIPNDLDDEIARYALSFPDTMDLFNSYVRRKEGSETWKPTGINQLDKILAPTFGLLAYQEQMLDILKEFFECSAVERNHIRRAIQRCDTEQVERYKADLKNHIKVLIPPHFTTIIAGEAARRRNIKVLKPEEFETVWSVLVSNPRAFLKAHAVSQVLASYKFDMGEGFIKKWKEIREYNEGLAGVKDADDRWGFIDKTGKLVIPCQWKKALFFSEGLVGVQDDNEKWGFIDKTGKVALPFVWSNVQWFRNGRVRVQTVLGGGWHDIDREGNDVQ